MNAVTRSCLPSKAGYTIPRRGPQTFYRLHALVQFKQEMAREQMIARGRVV